MKITVSKKKDTSFQPGDIVEYIFNKNELSYLVLVVDTLVVDTDNIDTCPYFEGVVIQSYNPNRVIGEYLVNLEKKYFKHFEGKITIEV